jgi:hypothetical protein
MADSGFRENGGLSPAEMEKYFGTPAGKKDAEGVLIMEDQPEAQPKREQVRPPEKRPPADAQLASEDQTSREFRGANDLKVLDMELDSVLDKIHNVQVGKIGGRKDNFSDLIVRNMVRDFATKLGKEQRKQDTSSLLGKVGRLGEELSRMGPEMVKFWQDQVSINRLELPN